MFPRWGATTPALRQRQEVQALPWASPERRAAWRLGFLAPTVVALGACAAPQQAIADGRA
ncbi:MAG: hypothetical protein U1F49_07805 [Rubrivivax sp.]